VKEIMGLESSNKNSAQSGAAASAKVHCHGQYAVKFTGPPSPPPGHRARRARRALRLGTEA